MEKICVAVRVRPPVNDDSSAGAYWKVDDNRISLQRSLGTPISGVSYAFDYVFDHDCTNERVYDLLTKDIIHAAVEGFNGTAFAYGQTSSGKTFTMNGSENDPGIIHRSVKDIFTKIQMATDREFLIRVSYMEIYNEEINDLFAVENQKLQIHESLDHGIFVAGLREEIVNSADQVLKLIESGEVNRHFGETNMNVRSSRSHTIFRMVIESKGKHTGSSDCSSLDDAIRVSVLNLVDLAGSERIAKTGAGGVRLKEGKYINKSLMILGNVINKLSDGGKQRGHIPYRDSKLTRILQPALGGNAKTSIICTLAPEEIHIEETKGTLQFASRAKRITNCVQVNEILTDAALLKRQKLEIEELREKLQGSRAEVLEQEILKLRNDMLKYELEHEKLAMELEEERKSHIERDQCIREQQMKINNLSTLVTSSGSDRIPSQVQDPASQSLREENSECQSVFREEAFETPGFKAAPNAFVVKRSNYSTQLDYSPFPDAHSNIADEDTWLKMNNGFVADLDSLQITPARKMQSFPYTETTPVSTENYKLEVQNLRRQLEFSLKEKNDLERTHAEQSLLNEKLMEELFELQEEAALVREVPRKLLESVVDCSDIYKDILSAMQNFMVDDRSSNSELLSSTSEIGACLFSTLENHFSSYTDGQDTYARNKKLIQEECKRACDRFKSTIKSIMLSEEPMNRSKLSRNLPCSENNKDRILGGDITFLKQKLGSNLSTIMESYKSLEQKLETSTQLLEMSKDKYRTLEREFSVLKEERDSLLRTVNSSSQRLAQMTDQKERVLIELNCEFQRRKDLQEEMKKFGAAFECRQKSLMSFHSEFKSRIENLKAHNQVSIPKPLRY